MSDPSQTPATHAPTKSRRRFVVLVLALLVVLVGGGAAYWFVLRHDVETSEADAPPAPAPASIVAFEPFVVNLADPGGSRFLRLTLAIVVAGEEAGKALEEDAVARMRIRSAILELLAQETSDALMTPDGKARLKKTIADTAARAAHGVQVSDVLFSEFVVQL